MQLLERIHAGSQHHTITQGSAGNFVDIQADELPMVNMLMCSIPVKTPPRPPSVLSGFIEAPCHALWLPVLDDCTQAIVHDIFV